MQLTLKHTQLANLTTKTLSKSRLEFLKLKLDMPKENLKEVLSCENLPFKFEI